MHSNPAFPVRHYLHGDLSDDGSGRAFCARCGAFHPAEHFDDEFHALIKLAKLAQSAAWLHKPADPGPRFRRREGAPNLFGKDLDALSKTVRIPSWER